MSGFRHPCYEKNKGMSKLALGTVQFGLSYGIANRKGKILRDEAKEILDLARAENINFIDTASSYGDSEEILGEIGVHDFNVVTKLAPLKADTRNIILWTNSEIERSIDRLKVNSLYGLLLHRVDQLKGPEGKCIAASLEKMRVNGVIQKLGVSIYSPHDLDFLENILDVDIVQAPLNLIDRRLVTSGWMKKLHERGVEIHVRSTFLQGLLLLPRSEIPEKFNKWSRIWDLWHEGLLKRNISAVSACLQYPLSLPFVDKIVVGVDSQSHLRELISASKTSFKNHDWNELVSEDEQLINPFNWEYL